MRPNITIQQSQQIQQLLDYAIQTLSTRQLLMQKYETLLFITHELEIEGLWCGNQLSGPNQPHLATTATTTNPLAQSTTSTTTTPATTPQTKLEPNLDGFCIVRRYTRLTDDNSQQLYQLQQELQQAYHSIDSTTSPTSQITRYATIATQQSIQYLIEIRIVNVQIARRVVETFGKIDLDLLETESAEDMIIADDEFDDMMASGIGGVDGSGGNGDGEKCDGVDLDKQLDSLPTPNMKQMQSHQQHHQQPQPHSTPQVNKLAQSQPMMTPKVPDHYEDSHPMDAFAPSIDFREDGIEGGVGGIEITLDLDDDGSDKNDNGTFSMKTVQDAVNRVEAMFGNDDDNGDFAIE